jgi:sterol 14-demethylase
MNVEFAKLYWDLDKCLSAFAFFFPNVPLPSFIDRNRARKRIGQIFQSVIDSRRANPGEVVSFFNKIIAKIEKHEDLVQTLMEAKYKDGTPLPDEHVIGLMVGILLAGQHTSNVTGAWLGVHLLSNPDVLKKCIDEQKKLVGDGELTFDQLKDSVYLYQVMRETLRLNPPIIMMMRRVVKDMPFKEYTIRKGSFVVASPALSHRLDTFYTNPDKFEPERFSPERAEDKKYSFSYLSFGGGKHGKSKKMAVS